MFANLPGDPGEKPRGAGEVAARGAARGVREGRGGAAPQCGAARRLQATKRRLQQGPWPWWKMWGQYRNIDIYIYNYIYIFQYLYI